MEIKVGIQNVGREVVLESNEKAEEISKAVDAAISNGTVLSLTDDKGRTVYIPGSAIGYVGLGTEELRRVGFGNL